MGSMKPCGVLIFDRKATKLAGEVVLRPCGAPARNVITINGDHLFIVCSRHNGRLERDGVRAA